jgi:hypothetical protein
MTDNTFSFRKSGPSGHGAGRLRFFVDLRDRCLGSIEGKAGDYRLDADYTGASTHAASPQYKTRLEAAQALAAAATVLDQPPVNRPEYSVLVRCQTRSRPEPLPAPTLSLARMLAARGLLMQVAGGFRTTSTGLDAIRSYDRWADRMQTDATPQDTQALGHLELNPNATTTTKGDEA